MVNALFLRKSQYSVIANEIGLGESEWLFVEQFVVSFKIMYLLRLTEKLQAGNLLMGVLFLFYLGATIKLKALSIDNPLKQNLLVAVETRKLKLFKMMRFDVQCFSIYCSLQRVFIFSCKLHRNNPLNFGSKFYYFEYNHNQRLLKIPIFQHYHSM